MDLDLQAQSSVSTNGSHQKESAQFQEASRYSSKSGIITTSALRAGVILSVTLLEKETDDPEYITANRHMEIGLVAISHRRRMLNEEYISKSKLVKINLFKEFLKSDSFVVGQSVGIMINDDELYTFINGINVDVIFRGSASQLAGELSAAINIAGRCSKVKIEMIYEMDCLKLLCLKTEAIEVKQVVDYEPKRELTCGTIVEVKCYPQCKNLLDIPYIYTDSVWIEAVAPLGQTKIRGLVATKNLKLVTHTKLEKLDYFSPIVRSCISEKKSACFSILKIFCVGSPGVGKTSLKYALQGKPPPKYYNSTQLTDKTERIYTASRTQHTTRNGSLSRSSTWAEYGYDQHIMQIASIAAHTHTRHQSIDGIETATMHNKDHLLALDHTPTTTKHHTACILPQPSTSAENILEESTDDKMLINDKTVLFSSIRNACVLTCDTASKDSALFEHIFFTDCGGQPQFIDALPTFLKGSMVLMIVINLSKSLDDPINFSYHVNGKNISLPGNYSALTTLQLIETIAHSMVTFCDESSTIPAPLPHYKYYMIVATHIDKVPAFTKQNKLNKTNSTLQKTLQDTLHLCIKPNDRNENEIIFPINTINDTNRAMMSEKIRDKISVNVNGRINISIPLRWHTFEIHIMAYCKKVKRSILSFNECLKVASSAEVQISTRDELKEVIEYYCQVNFFLYFSFLPDFVFCDSQFILDIISSLLKVSFSKSHSHEYLRSQKHLSRLRNHGIFNVHVLEICTNQVLLDCGCENKDIDDGLKFNIPGNIVTILENLNLIAQVSKTDFFLTLALQSCNEKELTRLKQSVAGSFDPLLLLPGLSKAVPIGVFASMIICLLKLQSLISINEETKQFNNAITLEYMSESGIKEKILVCNEIYWLDIRYSGYKQNDAYKIFKLFTEILPQVCKTLPYDHRKLAFSCGFFCHMAGICPNDKHKTKLHPCKVIANSPITVQCMQNPEAHRTKTLQQAEHIGKTSWFLTEDQLKKWQHENDDVQKQVNSAIDTCSLPQAGIDVSTSIKSITQSSSMLLSADGGKELLAESSSSQVAASNHHDELIQSETTEATKKRINLKRALERQKKVQFKSRNETYMKIYTILDTLLEESRGECIHHLEKLEKLEKLQQDKTAIHHHEADIYTHHLRKSQTSGSYQAVFQGSESCIHDQKPLLDSQLKLYLKIDTMIEDLQNLLICTEEKEKQIQLHTVAHIADSAVNDDRSAKHQHCLETPQHKHQSVHSNQPTDDQIEKDKMLHFQDHQVRQKNSWERRNSGTSMSDSGSMSRHDLVLMNKKSNYCQPGFIVYIGHFQGQTVAVKTPSNMTEHHSELLHQEMNIMSKLHHPNIIQFIGTCSIPEFSHVLLMELIDLSLKEVYEEGQLTDKLNQLAIIKDVAAGLYYLQCQRIIHCNITSSNILLAQSGTTKRIAKISEFSSAVMSTTRVTFPTTTCEAFNICPSMYSAPEMVSYSEHDVHLTTKVDIYSFGILACEVFCNKIPEQVKLPRMKQKIASTCLRIEQLIDLCILQNPENRPTAEMIIAELDTELRLSECC